MSNPIDSLLENNPTEFKESVYEALYEKLANRLETAKVDVAAAMFGQVQEETDEDEYFDEEEFDDEGELSEEFEDEDEDDFEEEGEFSDEDE